TPVLKTTSVHSPQASVSVFRTQGEWFVRSVVAGKCEIQHFSRRKSAVFYAERQRTKLRVHRVIWLDRI
ncbi:hypothetical protein AB4144_57760, partial [Rhizobiaceae sp. 2RAB30]